MVRLGLGRRAILALITSTIGDTMKNQPLILLSLLLLLGGLGPARGETGQVENRGGAPDETPAQAANPPEPEDAAEPTLPLEDLNTFAEVFGRIKSDYVESVEDRALLKGAIRGMLSWLDPHSAYLDGEEYRELQVGTSGEFGGLGIEVGLEDGFIKVISPIDDTPAQRAGLQAGDLIVRIDNRPVKGISLEDAVNLMRGKAGTAIELTILRAGTDQPFKVELIRDVIHVQSVKSRILAPGFGYVRISNFQSRTTEDLLNALSSLRSENEGDLKGLVLDLRNNPGGVLNSAVAVSDAFLAEGLIVYTKGRVTDSALEFKAGTDDVLAGAPPGGAGEWRLRLRLRDRCGRLAGSQTGHHHGCSDLRQGFGPDDHPHRRGQRP